MIYIENESYSSKAAQQNYDYKSSGKGSQFKIAKEKLSHFTLQPRVACKFILWGHIPFLVHAENAN